MRTAPFGRLYQGMKHTIQDRPDNPGQMMIK
jgi:hypothetical protein